MHVLITLIIALPSLSNGAVTQSLTDWNPKVYDAIKWTAPNQGRATLLYNRSHGITRVPMAYHGGVDTNSSGEITEQNIDKFTRWTQQFLPADYCGPVVMDYERPWWKELRAKTMQPPRLQEILSVYIKGIQEARRLRPEAQWGYWGLPATRHTGKLWRDQELSLESLIRQCTALYPDVYNDSQGKDNSSKAQKHISKVLEQAGGRVPVYVFVSPKYAGVDRKRILISDEVFIKQANAALQASWIDESGVQHRIKGLILWDAYGIVPESQWSDLDLKHAHYFELLHTLTTQWAKSMSGKLVVVEPTSNQHCQDGLPIPSNSSGAIYDRALSKRGTGRLKDTGIHDERIPSGRVSPN